MALQERIASFIIFLFKWHCQWNDGILCHDETNDLFKHHIISPFELDKHDSRHVIAILTVFFASSSSLYAISCVHETVCVGVHFFLPSLTARITYVTKCLWLLFKLCHWFYRHLLCCPVHSACKLYLLQISKYLAEDRKKCAGLSACILFWKMNVFLSGVSWCFAVFFPIFLFSYISSGNLQFLCALYFLCIFAFFFTDIICHFDRFFFPLFLLWSYSALFCWLQSCVAILSSDGYCLVHVSLKNL